MNTHTVQEREDVVRIAGERLKEFIAHPPQDARHWGIRTTSGTTGGAPLITAYRYPVSRGRLFKPSRTLQCYGSMSSRLFFAHLAHMRDTAGESVSLSLDGRDLGPGLERALDQFGAEIIAGYPSFVARASEHMSAGARARVTGIRLSGEFVDSGLRRLFEERFANAGIIAIYVSAETGRLSTFPCGHLPLNSYHPAEGVTVEVLSADASGAGELLISKNGEGSLPLVRYRIGDVGRIVDGACACGAPVTFEVLGRSGYDYLKLAGAIIRREEIDRVVRLCANDIRDFRLEASLVTRGDALKGYLELTAVPTGADTPDALGRIREVFTRELRLTPTRALGALVEEGVFLPLSVRFVKELPAMGKDVRLSMKRS